MTIDRNILALASAAALAAGRNAKVAPQLLVADIAFTLSDAVERGDIVLNFPCENPALTKHGSPANG